MSILKAACTDWTSYIEINRPNCLTLKRFAKKQGPNRFGRLIWMLQQQSHNLFAVGGRTSGALGESQGGESEAKDDAATSRISPAL
jgi:hypothetical protein